ncbi:MAG: hypothetical protein CMJ48_07935 [Planctomycetaceae bacterium]|nr:hypothetical protein [Planctomycetaceae bacterium]
MEPTDDQASEDQVSAAGVSGELKRLKSDTAASVDELREFVGKLRGRSPQEMLGLVAESRLVSGIVVSTIGIAAVLLVFTAIPYWLHLNEPTALEAAGAPAPVDSSEEGLPVQNVQADPVSPAGGSSAQGNDVTKAASAMGIDEAKTASPDSNPLEKKLDNLLDGVD